MRVTGHSRSAPNRPSIAMSFFASSCVPSYSHILSRMEQIEGEIKFRVKDAIAFETQLEKLGFRKKTPRTFERNILYDTPGRDLLDSGRLLRLRQYGGGPDTTVKAQAHRARP